MKSLLTTSLLFGLAVAVPHLHPRAARYDGFKVYRVETGEQAKDVAEKMAALDFEQWNRDTSKHIDFSVSPDMAERFKEMGLDFKELHKDLGKDIAHEGKWGPWRGEYSTIQKANRIDNKSRQAQGWRTS